MQYLGNMSQAWVLNSYAARLIVALNYHDVQPRNCDPDLEEEINSSVYWCLALAKSQNHIDKIGLYAEQAAASPYETIFLS